jgi:hypothetical protein
MHSTTAQRFHKLREFGLDTVLFFAHYAVPFA